MKSSVKKILLFWMFLLCGVWLFSFVTRAVKIETTPVWWVIQHTATLHSLYLWKLNSTELTWAWLRVDEWNKKMDLINWLVVGSSNSANWKLIVVGWWKNNTANWDGSAVGWWEKNTASNSVIAWWTLNKAEWWSVIAWWWWTSSSSLSQASNNWVILGWQNWNANWWVILWWRQNKAVSGSMVLWVQSDWKAWSFAWTSNPEVDSARILATNWLLVWTNSLLNGVKVVVSGAVKVWSSNLERAWEIKNGDECISAHDGNQYFALGWSSPTTDCSDNGGCYVWWIYIQDGDKVEVYDNYYGTSCTSRYIYCRGWTMDGTGYPYCYVVNPKNPIYWW